MLSAGAYRPQLEPLDTGTCAKEYIAMTTELQTIRDFLRYAVSQFRAAKLIHGHGTTSVVDEAAFLILETLHLPIEDINPWAEARLTAPERQALLDMIAKRIATRKPAAYLLNKTYMHGLAFYVDERVIVPRSFIGDFLVNGMLAPDGETAIEPQNIATVLDLCTGSGCLAVLASNFFPSAQIDATDLSADALDVARINLKNHDVEDQITLHHGDLFEPLKNKTYDLILANPPYVAKAETEAFPPEYKAEPLMAHLSGADGLDIVRRILKDVKKFLTPGGALICEIGTGRHIIEAEYPQLDVMWLDTEQSHGEMFLLRK
jgi:ribosomal protein L3 glutamine methyltransferase